MTQRRTTSKRICTQIVNLFLEMDTLIRVWLIGFNVTKEGLIESNWSFYGTSFLNIHPPLVHKYP